MPAFELPAVDTCIFCDRMGSESPEWQVLEESDLTLTVLTITQFEIGQSLVIPRRHAATLLDLTDDESVAVVRAARRIARALAEELAPLGILLYQNNGVYSGQEVPHFHLHVVPRREGSDWGVGPPHIARLDQRHREAPRRIAPTEQLIETAEPLRARLRSTP